MTTLLEPACILSEIAACLLYWRWRLADGRRAMLGLAMLLALVSTAAMAWLVGLGQTRFPLAMLGAYILAGLLWSALAGRRDAA